jgi:hypothetical protein
MTKGAREDTVALAAHTKRAGPLDVSEARSRRWNSTRCQRAKPVHYRSPHAA